MHNVQKRNRGNRKLKGEQSACVLKKFLPKEAVIAWWMVIPTLAALVTSTATNATTDGTTGGSASRLC